MGLQLSQVQERPCFHYLGECWGRGVEGEGSGLLPALSVLGALEESLGVFRLKYRAL